ncbi:hypothetical protein [Chitinophaga sancti]|uniref:Uncharacterized protein n=1 Tax=Chitinophaga sancti TaxID=1004 RepID=A0A1K1PGN5_9BACT|nr:hypothetical protein [Chitinophaga sancti]WQD65883.1 hypothetical protein U0033_15885 [Chitinophaga sancti]WQG88495.1 hypothetical protein SR876_26585 [Chitinophaga sancti]SFW46625.1 hypothetical protein SAMN05661012_01948 [Chitinophaga sancti]
MIHLQDSTVYVAIFGILASLIVFLMTRHFFSKNGKTDYRKKLEIANNEMLYSIRPLLVEKKVPSKEILMAVRFSTAKKYGVEQNDLYDEFSLTSDLINETIANSFLTSDQKLEFCNLLQSIK